MGFRSNPQTGNVTASALIVLLCMASPRAPAESTGRDDRPERHGPALNDMLRTLPKHTMFQHRFTEHPDMASVLLEAMIAGDHITLVNPVASSVFPAGVIAEGTLMWHAPTSQWIIGHTAADRDADEVGGCSTGPDVVDLHARIYWTC